MTKSKLIRIQAPMCIATAAQAKRQAEQSARKRETRIEPHKPKNGFFNLHPKINSFKEIRPDSYVTTSIKRIINTEGNDATIVVESDMNFNGPRHKITGVARVLRRETNREARIRHKNFRRRKPHGRSVV